MQGSGLFLVYFTHVVWALPGPTPVTVSGDTYTSILPASEPTAVREDLRRDLGGDIESYVGGLISEVASGVSSFVGSGILDFPTGFPTGSAVESSLGISGADLEAQPTQVLNLP